jgi:hypothetical protein
MGSITRRQFLKMSGAAGLAAAAAGAFGGYRLWEDIGGEPLSLRSPFAEPPDRRWPWSGRPAPILLVANERAIPSTGAYLAEILRAEGLNAFRVASLSALRMEILERFPMVVLSAGPLEAGQGETLRRYVARGGRLIAMRPPPPLADLFGLESTSGQTAEGYIRIRPEHPMGQGFPRETLQFHGVADHYRPAGAEVVAFLAGKTGDLPFPAVTLYPFGEGQAGCWAFDPAWSIALTRQGNPNLAHQERDGLHGLRAHELFDSWIDLDRIGIPQADELMRLLGRMITGMLLDRLPLPRIWYFPDGAPGILVATGDAHNTPPSAVEEVLRRVEARGGTFSVYYAPQPRNRLQRAWHRLRDWVDQAAAHVVLPDHVWRWRARGHEFGLHPYVEEGLEVGWRRYYEVFTGMGYRPVPPTVRTHRVLWSGWVETARFQAACGIRMNLDFYHVGPMFRKPDGEWVFGYFTGSGLPMRFVDEEGRVLNIYQQLTALVDEQLIGWTWPQAPQFPLPIALEISRSLIRRGAEQGEALALQAHVDPFAIGGEAAETQARWLEGILDEAVGLGVLIWSAQRWLEFVEARDQTELEEVRWDPERRALHLRIRSPVAPARLTLALPLEIPGGRLHEVRIDGSSVPYRERSWKGIPWAWMELRGGTLSLSAFYGPSG